jgi:hypothetical protein
LQGKAVFMGRGFECKPVTGRYWSPRAFDRIWKKIPEGELPCGCREKDVESYKKFLGAMGGENVAEFFKNRKRTCFQNEWYLEKNFGQRIDHILAERSLLTGEGLLKIDQFEVLQEFGGGRRGCSDHCPLWMRLIKPGEKDIQAMEVEGTKENLPEISEFSRHFRKIAKGINGRPESFENFQGTPEFLDGEDDFESEERSEIMEVGQEFEAFEDCQFPVLQCQIGNRHFKILVDSGANLSLINEKVSHILVANGHPKREVPGVRIRVANGNRCTAKETISVPLGLGEETSEPVEFLIIRDLPFDFILGTPILQKWNANLDFARKTLTLTPGPRAKQIQAQWTMWQGQHWRRPITLVAQETSTIPPLTQYIIGISELLEEHFQGYHDSSRSGLVTPIRNPEVLTRKFTVAYVYGENITKLLVANLTNEPIIIKKGTPVAEYHLRNKDQWELRSHTHTHADPQHAPAQAEAAMEGVWPATSIEPMSEQVQPLEGKPCESASGDEANQSKSENIHTTHTHTHTHTLPSHDMQILLPCPYEAIRPFQSNRIEINRNEINRNETNRNETNRNETKRNSLPRDDWSPDEGGRNASPECTGEATKPNDPLGGGGEYNRIETIQVCSKEQESNRIETIQVCSKEQESNRNETSLLEGAIK